MLPATLELANSERGDVVPDRVRVVTAVEVEGYDLADQPAGSDLVEGPKEGMPSLRLAASAIHTIGIPFWSVSIDRF